MPCCILAAISGPFVLLISVLRRWAAPIFGVRTAGAAVPCAAIDPGEKKRLVTPLALVAAVIVEISFFGAIFENLTQRGSIVAEAETAPSHICAFASLARLLGHPPGGPSRHVP